MKRFVFASLCLLATSLYAQDPQVSRSIKNMGYSINNLDQEVSQLKEKTQNQDSIIDSVHKEVRSLVNAAKEVQKSAQKQVETFVQDLKKFKKYADASSATLTQIQTKLAEQEQIVSLQAQQIKELETALRLLVQAVQGGADDAKEYTVQAGDTLDKIAKKHSTTVQAIKKHNNLKKDIIYPAQKLRIP